MILDIRASPADVRPSLFRHHTWVLEPIVRRAGPELATCEGQPEYIEHEIGSILRRAGVQAAPGVAQNEHVGKGIILDILAAVADGRGHGPGSMSGRRADAAGAVTMENTATTRSADAKLVVRSGAED